MPKFNFLVCVETDTLAHAETALGSRLSYDEEIEPEDGGPFDYEFAAQRFLGVVVPGSD